MTARAAAQRGQPVGSVRELRLAVVCYGGVSLAIYMHGIVKELHKLVLASTALDQDSDRNPFRPKTTEAVYWELLSRIARGETGGEAAGARLRVVVDIIAGTSAGGINGVFLAKALAGNHSLDALRQLWFEKGDIKLLLRGWRRLPATVKVAWMAYRAVRSPLRIKPPLRGDDMARWLFGALEDMQAETVLAEVESLVPEDQSLQLFVPITDFHGYDREIPLYDPRFIRDRTHRHVMEFRHDRPGRSHFVGELNHVLAFAARATSSFPGAFPPVSFKDYESCFQGGAGLAELARDFFPFHALARFDPDRTHFIDGGVLDNFPFQSAIEAIAAKPAAADVDRRLLYIEPDPGEDAGARLDGESPSLYRTILGGYAAIPRKEPILDDLLRLAQRNQAVLRIRDVIESSFSSVSAHVDELLREVARKGKVGVRPTGEELAGFRARVEERALEEAGFSGATYLRVRIRSMVDSYAAAVSRLCGFPPGAYQSGFVTTVLRHWAADDGLLEQRPDDEQRRRQRQTLAAFDLGYHERRIRFMIAGLSWLYPRSAEPGFPSRTELDQAKGRLYRHVFALDAIAVGLEGDPELRALVRAVFSQEELTSVTGEDEYAVARFVARHRAALASVRDSVGSAIADHLPAVDEGLHHDLLELFDTCDARVTGDLLTRYVGFPFWDVLVFPLQAVSGVGERDHVEVYRMSPRDVSLLTDSDEDDEDKAEKLKGMSLFHFGAFFSRSGRERDYLWGRLDGAERLVKLLLDVRREPSTLADVSAAAVPPEVSRAHLAEECRPVFRAILDEEASSLPHASNLLGALRARVEAPG